MTTHAPGTAAPSTAAGPVLLPGTPVVPGVAWGPVVRPSGAVALPGDDGVVVREEERAGEGERFTAAAGVVADRLNARAGAATGVSAEVLAATAGLARDRGLLSAVEQRIDAGTPAAVATVQAAQQFVDLFTSLGGLMAERVTDVRDVRDRIVAQLTGQGEPGVPSPEQPSCWPRTSRRPTPRGWTRPASPAWPPGWVARPATPRSSPASSGCPA